MTKPSLNPWEKAKALPNRSRHCGTVLVCWLRAQRCVTLLRPLTSNSSTGFDGRIQPPSVKLVDRGPMQNLAYSLWTRPGAGPLPIGRIGGIGDLGRLSWRIFLVGLWFQYSRGSSGGCCCCCCFRVEGPRESFFWSIKSASRVSLFTSAASLNSTPLYSTALSRTAQTTRHR